MVIFVIGMAVLIWFTMFCRSWGSGVGLFVVVCCCLLLFLVWYVPLLMFFIWPVLASRLR